MQEKMNDLMTQVKAVKNTNVTNIMALKHNATIALAMATELLQELVDTVADQKKEIRALKKRTK